LAKKLARKVGGLRRGNCSSVAAEHKNKVHDKLVNNALLKY
jgi:hypothetical protein